MLRAHPTVSVLSITVILNVAAQNSSEWLLPSLSELQLLSFNAHMYVQMPVQTYLRAIFPPYSFSPLLEP